MVVVKKRYVKCYIAIGIIPFISTASFSKEENAAYSYIASIFIPFSNDILFSERYSDGRNAGFCATKENKSKLFRGIDRYILKTNEHVRDLAGLSTESAGAARQLFSKRFWPLTCDIFGIDGIDIRRSYTYIFTGAYSILNFSGKASWLLSCDSFHLILREFNELFKGRFYQVESDDVYRREQKEKLRKTFPSQLILSISGECSSQGEHSFVIKFQR